MTQGAFRLQLAAFAQKVGERAETVVRKVGIDMLRNVVLQSPVDTGRFRANWQVGLAEVGTRRDATDPGGQATIRMGADKISGTPLGESIWISNSLPYARRLEYGYSKQAPQGMVRITVVQFQAMVDKAVRELR